jgi:molybdopterin synthase sulfur carrier subunit
MDRVAGARKLRKPHRQERLCYLFRKLFIRWPKSWKAGKHIEMKITVEIPSALRRFTDGVQTIECSSETLPDLLGEIEQRFPAINKHLRDDTGQVRRFVNIYVNEEDIRFLGGNSYKFREGDRVLVVPSIAGGAPADACG